MDAVPEEAPLVTNTAPPPTSELATASAAATPALASAVPDGGRVVILDVHNSHSVEYVDIANPGDTAVALGGWHMYGSSDHDDGRDDYYFPAGFTLGPGEIV